MVVSASEMSIFDEASESLGLGGFFRMPGVWLTDSRHWNKLDTLQQIDRLPDP